MAVSLNKFVSFYPVLSALGSPPRSRVLPTLVDCFACRGRLSLLIQPDVAFGGEWGWCRRCNLALDMIEFAAAAWKLDIGATLTKLRNIAVLAETPTHAEIAEYLDSYVNRRIKIAKFYSECRRAFGASAAGELRVLQRKFGFDRTVIAEPDARLPVGAATPEKLAALGLSGCSAIKGGKHAAVLVVPFYDLPGRICGLLCVTGDDPAVEPVFLSTLPGDGPREGGIGMLPAALTRASADSIVAVTDPGLAITLQFRQAKELGRPLPLILVRSGPKFPTQRAWDNLPMADVVFWAPSDHAAAVKQARPFDAKVSTREITPNEREHNLRRFSPSEWLTEVRRAADSWHAVLRQRLRAAAPADLEAMLLGVDLSAPELRRFIAGCDLSLRARLTNYLAKDTPRVIQYDSTAVREKDGKWWADCDLISDAIIRFDAVIVGDDKQSYYRGRILFREHVVPFTEKTTVLEGQLLTWAAKHLRDTARAGIMQFHPKWDRKACGVAIAFNEPGMAAAIEHVGWNAEHQRYIFPTFSIGREGRVENAGVFLSGERVLPGAELTRPEPLLPAQLEILSARTDEVRFFWAAAAAVIANITAPRWQVAKRGVIFPSGAAQHAGFAAARGIGCLDTTLWNRAPPKIIEKARGGHGWSVILRPGTSKNRRYDDWVSLPAMVDAITAMAVVPAWITGMRKNWVIVEAPSELSDGPPSELVGRVFTAYIQDTMTRPMITACPDHAIATLRDLAGWFERAGGEPKVLAEAEALIGTATTQAPFKFFMRVIAWAYAGRKILFAASDAEDRGEASIVYDKEAETIWVDQKAFASLVNASMKLAPDIPTITEAIKTCEGFIGEKKAGWRMGWLFKHEWWIEQLKELDNAI